MPVYSNDLKMEDTEEYKIKPVEYDNFENGILICYLDKNDQDKNLKICLMAQKYLH